MATNPQDPPDETPWWSPEIANEMAGVHENTVLFYFQRSPFCDPTCNNINVFNQCVNTFGMQNRLANREIFSETVAQLPGIEYVVHLSLRDQGAGDAPPGMGRWVIRKQKRTKRPAPQADDIQVLGTYFVLGQVIFQAPSLADILWSRLLSASDALLKITDTFEKQHAFVPAHGHAWFHPTLKAPSSSKAASAASQAVSRAGSPTPSDTASLTGAPDESRAGADDAGIATAAALRESFTQFMRYGGDYMDENPLVGEPGAFVFSNSAQAVQKRREDAERAVKEREEQERKAREKAIEMAMAVKKSTPVQGDTGTPRDVEKVKNEARERRASGMGRPRIKRKKSRAPGSPTSPLSGYASPMAMSPVMSPE